MRSREPARFALPRAVLCVSVALVIGGCAKMSEAISPTTWLPDAWLSEEPAETVTELTLIAADDVNPNFAGVPSPIVVVLYELAEPRAFEGGEFSQLFYDDGSTLGNAIIDRQELHIEPGQIVTESRVLDPKTTHLGIVAGYRTIEGKRWRLTAAVAPGTSQKHVVLIGDRAVSLAEVAPGRGDS